MQKLRHSDLARKRVSQSPHPFCYPSATCSFFFLRVQGKGQLRYSSLQENLRHCKSPGGTTGILTWKARKQGICNEVSVIRDQEVALSTEGCSWWKRSNPQPLTVYRSLSSWIKGTMADTTRMLTRLRPSLGFIFHRRVFHYGFTVSDYNENKHFMPNMNCQ